MRQYEPIDADLETISFVRVENVGETVTAHRVAGQKESGILGYLSGMRGLPQTLYFTRVSVFSLLFWILHAVFLTPLVIPIMNLEKDRLLAIP